MRAGLAFLSMCLALSAQADVSVSFLKPEGYTDAGGNAVDVKRVTDELSRYLEKLGSRYLKPEQNLTIEVLDIDLAGRVSTRTSTDLRVMRGGADWPRMRMRYALETPGQAPRSGEEILSDHDYMRVPNRETDALAHEKRMLDDWFRARFRSARNP